jgi:ankyrin repeat protein
VSADTGALLVRIADGRTDLVLDCMAAGLPATAADAHGVRLIEHCARYGDLSALRLLLSHGESLATLGTDHGLRGAAFHGHWRLCEFLVEHGADASATDAATGEAPLHAALCEADRPATGLVVEVLLRAGADVHACTIAGAETGDFMRDVRTRGETPLHRAAAFASLETIELLLAAGARIDARDVHGDTPLTWASWHLRPDAILRVLCHGSHRIHPRRGSTYDHGTGWGHMELSLLGRPRR